MRSIRSAETETRAKNFYIHTHTLSHTVTIYRGEGKSNKANRRSNSEVSERSDKSHNDVWWCRTHLQEQSWIACLGKEPVYSSSETFFLSHLGSLSLIFIGNVVTLRSGAEDLGELALTFPYSWQRAIWWSYRVRMRGLVQLSWASWAHSVSLQALQIDKHFTKNLNPESKNANTATCGKQSSKTEKKNQKQIKREKRKKKSSFNIIFQTSFLFLFW